MITLEVGKIVRFTMDLGWPIILKQVPMIHWNIGSHTTSRREMFRKIALQEEMNGHFHLSTVLEASRLYSIQPWH